MSFRKNDSQQISINDSLCGLTQRELKALDKSWAKVFAEEVFPMIDEERFGVLYSDKASRPNTPVNVIVGSLILKELFDLSDDEIVENLMLDFRFRYALHTTSFSEQPLSDKSLTRFRQRCYNYEKLYNVDLYHDCVIDLAGKTAKLMKIDGRIRRMDSTMIEANIRRLSRMELIYTCIANLVTYIHMNDGDELIEGLTHYYEPDDFNRVIYHSRGTEAAERIKVLLSDADTLIERCGNSYEEVNEYNLLVRCISEQSVVEAGKRRLKTSEDKAMNSNILQNPSDPDATYRSKAGKAHRGYVANIEESVGHNGTVVTDYQFDSNNRSDSSMLKEHLQNMTVQAEKTTIITDGAYSGKENEQLASEKNVELITTDLTGRTPNEICTKFKFSDDGTRIIECPAGHAPKSSSFIRQSESCTASFERDYCKDCPFKEQCKAKIFKRVAKVRISTKSVKRAQTLAKMQTEEFKNYAKLRNGVETIPSILKNRFNANKMPVRGKQRSKFFFGSKIAALNFRKLFNYLMGQDNYAPNQLLGV